MIEVVDVIVKVAAQVSKHIIEVAVIAAKLLAVPFGVPFDHSYHNDIAFDFSKRTDESDISAPTFNGFGEGLALDGTGAQWSLHCVDCGVRGNFTIDGRFGFTLSGITNGSLTFQNNDPFVIAAVFGLRIEAQLQIPLYEKRLETTPLTPFVIPGLLTLGPELTVDLALDIFINGKIDLIAGARFELSPGTVVLDMIDKTRNNQTGLEPSLKPVFRV